MNGSDNSQVICAELLTDDHLTNLGVGTHTHGAIYDEYWVLNYKNHFSLSICMQINHCHVERHRMHV